MHRHCWPARQSLSTLEGHPPSRFRCPGTWRLRDIDVLRNLQRRVEIGVACLIRRQRAGAAGTMVTVVPDTVHTPGVSELWVTVRLELAVATGLMANVPFNAYVCPPCEPKVMVWFAFCSP